MDDRHDLRERTEDQIAQPHRPDRRPWLLSAMACMAMAVGGLLPLLLTADASRPWAAPAALGLSLLGAAWLRRRDLRHASFARLDRRQAALALCCLVLLPVLLAAGGAPVSAAGEPKQWTGLWKGAPGQPRPPTQQGVPVQPGQPSTQSGRPSTQPSQPSAQPGQPSTPSSGIGKGILDFFSGLFGGHAAPIPGQKAGQTGNPGGNAAGKSSTAPNGGNALTAGPTNGSFEGGNLAGWTLGGTAAHAEALNSGNFAPGITPPAGGSFMALLCNGAGSVGPTGQSNLDGDPGPTEDNDRTSLGQSFTVAANEVPATLSFDWSWLTAENPGINSQFDDFFMVTLNSANILVGSANGKTLSPFANVPTNGLNTTVASAGLTNGCHFNFGYSSFQHFSMLVTTPGVYNLQYLVSDQGNGDASVDSGLLIDNVLLTPAVDLAVTKTAIPNPIVAGAPFLYRVSVTNQGTGIATNVVVTDTLPGEALYLSDSQNCDTTALPVIVCQLGNLTGGQSTTFDVNMRANADILSNGQPVTLQNLVTVGNDTIDPITANDSFTLTNIVRDIADLRVTKIGKPDKSVRAGGILSYTVYVDNLGPSDAQTVTLTDTMVSNLPFSLLSLPAECSSVPAAPGPSGRFDLTCTLDTLSGAAPGGRWTLEYVVSSNDTSSINNVASVRAVTPDPVSANNNALVEHEVTDTADLSITKIGIDPFDGDFVVLAGQEVEYTIVVANNGPSTAENVTVVDALPPGLNKNSLLANFSTSAGPTGICTVGTPGNALAPMVCQIGNIPSGESATITVNADVDPSFVVDSPTTAFSDFLSNDAYTYSDVFDPDTSNNRTNEAFVEIVGEADLQVFKNVSPPSQFAGNLITYEIIVSNLGPSTAEDVLLADTLPAGLTFVTTNIVNGTGGEVCEYQAGANAVTCSLGDIPPGAPPFGQRFVYIQATIDPNQQTGPITNTVTTLSFPTFDPDFSDNFFDTELMVDSAALVDITKVASTPAPVAGKDFYYTITVSNKGPSTAHNVIITDVLPANVTYLYDTANCGQAALAAGCLFGELAPGNGREGNIQFQVHVRVNANADCDGVVTNTATASWEDGQDGLAISRFDSSTTTVPIDCVSDVRVRKFGKRDGTVRAGDVLTYTVIVDNLGPSEATTVTLKDALQSSGIFDFTSLSSDRASTCIFTPAGPPPIAGISQRLLFDCSLDDPLEVLGPGGLPVNPGRWIITATVTAPQVQDINNVATVLSNAVDPDQTNNEAQVEHTIQDIADLQVTKSDSPDPVIAGTALTYTIRITNHGPSDAENVKLLDRLPAGIVVTGVSTSNGATCATGTPANPSDKLTCGLGTIRSTGAVTTVVVTVNATVNRDVPNGTILENDVNVVASTYDPNSFNDFAFQLTTVNGLSNLVLTKAGLPIPVIAGQDVHYFFTVLNTGPSTAFNVRLLDVLGAGGQFLTLTSVDFQGSTGTCYQANVVVPTVRCNLGDLPVGRLVRVDLVFHVNANTPNGTLLNDVLAAAADSPIVANTPTFTIPVIARADLEIIKTSEPVTVYAGELKKYTIQIINHGPSDAQNVVVTDTLPAEVSYEVDTALCDNSGSLVTCGFGTIPLNGSRTFDIYTRVDPAIVQNLLITPPGTTITNTATVDSTTVDPIPANNTAFRRNFVQEKADLKVTKFGKRDGRVRAGDILTYTVIVDNLGPSFAYSVTLKDILQSSLDFDVIDIISDRAATCRSLPPGGAPLPLAASPWPPTAAPPAFGVNAPTGVANVNQRYELDCTLANPLAVLSPAGGPQNPGRWIVTMRVRARQEQDVNNVATVQSDIATDPDRSNNQAQVEHEITAVADLQVTKTDFPDPVVAGTPLTYTIRITNNGPSDAENVVLFDRLPPGIVVTGASTSNGGTCVTGAVGSVADQLTCGLGNIRSTGAVTTVVITVNVFVNANVSVGTVLENDVFVTSDVFDDKNENNFAHQLTTVGNTADLSIQKFGNPGPVRAGEETSYDIPYANAGPSVAHNVVINDVLPPGFTILSVSVIDGPGTAGLNTCHLRSGDPTLADSFACEIGDMAPGQTGRLVVRVFIRPDALAGPHINFVSITSDTFDPVLADNFANFTNNVVQVADMQVVKTSAPVTVYAGEQKKYTITITNNGPSDAQNVVVTDTLPVQAQYQVDTALCGHGGTQVTCGFGTVPVGQSRSFDIYTIIDPATLQDLTIVPPGLTITNTAQVASTTTDPLLANNTAFRRNFVQERSDLHITKFGKRDAKVRAGDVLTYTVIVDNLGPSYAYSVTLKDVLQSSGTFDVIDVATDRAATCRSVPPGGAPIALAATPWPPTTAPPAFGVLVPTGVANVSERYELDCTLASPLAVVSPVGGPQNPGRWIITVRVRARQEQDIDNVAYTQSDIAIDPSFANNSAFVEHEITAVADLQVTKTDVPDPVVAGTPLTFTIRITNNGPSDAENVVLYDRLPPGLVLTGVTTSSGATCVTGAAGNPADRMTCGLGNIRSTGPVTTAVIVVTTMVNSLLPAGTILENDVYVTSDVFDDHNENNFANSLTTAGALSNLFVSKTDFPDPVQAGTQLEYRIRIENRGPSNAVNVRISDTLPSAAFVTFVNYNVGNGAGTCFYQASTNELDCNLGDIAVGSYREVFVRVFVNASTPDGTVLTNDIVVLADSPIVFVPGSDFTEATTVIARADMQVVKTSAPVTVYAGEQKKYSITITNNGPSDALSVVVTDTLPAQALYQIDTGLCSHVGQVLTCPFGTVPVGGSRSFDIYTVIDPSTTLDLTINPPGRTITNTATVTSTTVDPLVANNTALRSNFVQHKADLKVVKFGKRDGQVRAGDILTYTVIVDNLGPSYAYSVTLKDVLQSSGIYDVIDVVSDRAATCRSLPPGGPLLALPATPWPPTLAPPAFGVLPPTGVANVNQRYELDCTLANLFAITSPAGGPQNPGRWILTVRVRAQQAQSVNNAAYVQSDVALDPITDNNNAFVEHEITAIADLQVTKTDVPDPVVAGTPLTFTIRITNNGPSDAENTVLVDRLPPGIVLTGVTTSSGATCETGTPGNVVDRLTCGLGNLRSTGPVTTAVITLTTLVNSLLPQGTILENDVFVFSDVFDDRNQNNYANSLTTVGALSNLFVQKTDFPDPVQAGTQLEYKIRIENRGPSNAVNVRISDTLPAAALVSFVNYAVGNGTGTCFYQASSNEVDCTLGDIAVGSYREVFVRVFVKALTPDGTVLTNNVQVLADSPIAFVPGSDFTEPTTVIARADMQIEKTSTPVTVYAGEQKKYTLTITNNGPSDALNVVVTDTLPAQALYQIDTGLCSHVGQTVSCAFGTVPVGGTRTWDIYTVIDPATTLDLTINPPGRTITNTATVASTTVDPLLANNTALRSNFVQQKADLKVTKFGKKDGAVRAGDILTYTVIVDNLGPSFAYSVTLKDLLQSSGLFDVIDVVSDRAATCRSLPPGGAPIALPATPWPPTLAPPAFGVLPPTGVANVNQRYELDCTLGNLFAVVSPVGGPQNPGRWILTVRVRAQQSQSVNNVAYTQSDVAIDPDFDNNDAHVEHEITSVADLQVTKTDLPHSVVAGTALTYTIRITNIGPSDAENVVMLDRLPAGIVVTGVSTSSGATCATGAPGNVADRLTCGLGTLRSTGAITTAVITVTAIVNSGVAQGTILENDVYVTSDVFDNNDANNYANTLTTVGALSTLTVSKTDFPDPVPAGTQLEYRIRIVNNGPSVAVNVRISDTLPSAAFVTFLNYNVGNGPGVCFYQNSSNEVDCNLGDIGVGSYRDVFIRVLVNASTPDGTVLFNSVQVLADSPIAFSPGSDFTETTTVNARSDLLIEKTSTPVTVYAGEQKKYTIKVTNNGPSDALNVVVTDTLPAQALYQIDTGGCSHTGQIVVCSLGTIPPGGMRSFDIYVLIDPATTLDLTTSPPGRTITNTATVGSSTVDLFPANNTATRTNFVQQKADLKIVKFGKRDGQVRAGDVLTYTVIVDNLGPSYAYSVTVKDLLQGSGLFDVIDVVSDRGATCRSLPPGGPVLALPATPWPPTLAPPPFGVIPPTGVANVNQRYELDCTLGATFAVISPVGGPQNPGRWILTVRVRSQQSQSLNNVAHAESDVALDPEFGNNDAEVEHEISSVADLQITKTDAPDPVVAGTPLTYTIRITNNGPSDAENVVLYDRLPPGIVVTGASASNGATCVTGSAGNAADKLSCGLGTLRSTGPVTTVVVTVNTTVNSLLPQGTLLENDVYVTSDVFDMNNANNFANSLTMVGALSNLFVTKTDFPDPVVAGTQVEYRVRIENRGPSNAVNVRISDTLPSAAFVGFLNYNVGNGSGVCFYQASSNEIDCNVGDIAVGSYREIFFRLLVDSATPDGTVLTDTVSVLADSPIAFVAGSDFTESTNVVARADMIVQKSSTPVIVYAGEQKRYTIQINNNGPSVARNVVVTDTLPAEVNFEIDTGLCSNVGNVVTCGFGTLPVGASRVFDIYARVNPATTLDLTLNPPGRTITNTAQVGSTTVDPDPASNTARSRNFVIQKSDLKVTKFGKKDGAVRAGEILTYTVIVDNLGPSYAYSVTLKDVLQSSGTFDVIDVSSDRPATCRSLPPGGPVLSVPGTAWPPTSAPPAFGVIPPTGVAAVVQQYQLDCSLSSLFAVVSPVGGPQNPGRWILTVRVRAPQPQSVNNIAYTQSDVAFDPDYTNNTARVEHEVTTVADLQVGKSAVGETTTAGCPPGTLVLANQVSAGRLITYTITITNDGSSDAENVVLYDRLPPGITLLGVPTVVSPANASVNCNTGTPGSANDKLTCGVAIASAAGDTNPQPRLRTNQVVTFRFTARTSPSLSAGTILENDAYVTSGVFDDDSSNNFASQLTTVGTAADLSLTKTDNPATVIAGQLLNYTIGVTNSGPSDAQNVVVVDTLPAEVAYVSAAGASCVQDPISTRVITCSLGAMPAGTARFFGILVQVRPDGIPSGSSTTTITNQATVRSDTFDPCLTNNSATEPTTVLRSADVFVTKSDNPDPVLAGNEEAYTIVFGNKGQSTATTVAVNDTLGLGLTFKRCESIDPNDTVTCQVVSGDGNTTPQVVRLISIARNNTTVWSSTTGNAVNDLDPGESYTFRLVATVESGYVLNNRGDTNVGQACRALFVATGYPHFAADQVRITSLNDAALADNNFDDECTRVNAVGDLSMQLFDDLASLQASSLFAASVGEWGNIGGLGNPGDFSDLTGNRRVGGAVDGNVATTSGTMPPSVASADGKVATTTGAASATTSGTAPVDGEGGNAPTPSSAVSVEAMAPTAPMQVNPFLSCDPAAPGGTINYFLIVKNLGPSDAAQVFVVDQLPAQGIVLDPNQVVVTVSRGQVVEKRDDGQITILAGNDPNNLGQNQIGRLNAGSAPVTITISVMVRQDALCGSRPRNTAFIETRRNDVLFPLGVGVLFARTPTVDLNLANNVASVDTLIFCPSLRVRKTVSFDGKCPGLGGTVLNQPGKPVKFCFQVTNTGDSFLDTIRLTDTLRTRSGTQVIFTTTILAGLDPKVPLGPGETVTREVTLPAVPWNECGTLENRVDVSAIPVNGGRTVFPCVGPLSATDSVNVSITCAGLDYRLALPALNTDKCLSWVQVQNAGNQPVRPMLVVWGDYGSCAPQSAGPLKIECGGLLKPGAAWSFTGAQLPAGARSALVYSLNATDVIVNEQGVDEPFANAACFSLFNFVVGNDRQWGLFDAAYRTTGVYKTPKDQNGDQLVLDFGAHRGQPLAVMVNRDCPDTADPNVRDHASYIGIGSDGQGAVDPVFGGYTAYAPLVFAGKGGLNTWLYIQNTGILCSSLELWFKSQDNCLRPILGDVLTLSPGETVHFDPNAVVGPDFIGSVWVRASQPMAMVVDTMGPNHFTSYAGIPGDVDNDPMRFFSLGAQVNYAPLTYSEYQGWDTLIQVQNLSAVVPAKVKVYFFDRSGGIITTLADWICPRGSQTFFLPLIASLPGNWAGYARIESQEWWSPGSPAVDPPRIQSVVLLERWGDAQRTVRREAAAYNAPTECTVYDWQLGKGKGGTQSGSAVIGLPLVAKSNRNVTSEIAITNIVPKPGFTDFAVYLYDQNGLLDYICQKVSEREVDYLDLSTYGWVPPNFMGSAVISAVFWEHDVFDAGGTFLRNVVGLAAVNVERIGSVQGGPDVPGDESKASEGIPLFDFFMPMGPPPNCPGVGGVRP